MLKLLFSSIKVYIMSMFKNDFFSCSLKARIHGRTNKKERHIHISQVIVPKVVSLLLFWQ